MSEEECTCTSEKVMEFLQKMAKEGGFSDLTELGFAEFLSESDGLKHVRDQFYYPKCGTLPDVDPALCDPESDSIYLCGNSLGLMPKATERIMMEQLDKWAKMGVFGHTKGDLPWAHCDECAVEGVAELVGAKPEEIALCNGLTVNIHVLLAGFYKPTETRHKIVLETKAFPSDHYAIESQIRLHGRNVEESMVLLTPREGEACLRTEDILSYIEQHGEEIAIIFLPGIQYYTGQLFDIHTITRAGKEKTDHRDRMLGWWSHRMETRFNMDNVLDLDDGAAGYRISNPPIHLVVPVMGILEVFKTVKLEDLRSRSCYLTGYLEYLIKHFFGESSEHRTTKIFCSVITPAEFHERGCQLSLRFSVSIDVVYKELVKRGVAVDKRYPDVIRVTPVHLYNNYVDCRRFITALQESCVIAEASL
ncbi:hypothetical protein RB195_026215 [Necator americanus]|uniref:Kynureninase n=1 Tax=Necator americanus TaxID=51031 RepID=A0ABR1EY95_NECAM